MATKELNKKDARFDTRLSKEQKELFEKAASIGGYRSLTDFVVATVHQKATEIIAAKEEILSSQRDREIFFDTLMNPPEPNEALQKVAEEFNAIYEE